MNANTNYILINFGTNIKLFRKTHGITQEDLCDELGMDVKEFRKLEKGILNPRVSTVEDLVDYFQEFDENVTLEKLLEADAF